MESLLHMMLPCIPAKRYGGYVVEVMNGRPSFPIEAKEADAPTVLAELYVKITV